MKRSSIAVIMVIVGLALAVSSAVALGAGGTTAHQSAARAQYKGHHRVFVSQLVATQPAATQPAAATSTLPFTGSELGVIVALGLALAGGGFLLERGTRKS